MGGGGGGGRGFLHRKRVELGLCIPSFPIDFLQARVHPSQRERKKTRELARQDFTLACLSAEWNASGDGSCKRYTVLSTFVRDS